MSTDIGSSSSPSSLSRQTPTPINPPTQPRPPSTRGSGRPPGRPRGGGGRVPRQNSRPRPPPAESSSSEDGQDAQHRHRHPSQQQQASFGQHINPVAQQYQQQQQRQQQQQLEQQRLWGSYPTLTMNGGHHSVDTNSTPTATPNFTTQILPPTQDQSQFWQDQATIISQQTPIVFRPAYTRSQGRPPPVRPVNNASPLYYSPVAPVEMQQPRSMVPHQQPSIQQGGGQSPFRPQYPPQHRPPPSQTTSTGAQFQVPPLPSISAYPRPSQSPHPHHPFQANTPNISVHSSPYPNGLQDNDDVTSQAASTPRVPATPHNVNPQPVTNNHYADGSENRNSNGNAMERTFSVFSSASIPDLSRGASTTGESPAQPSSGDNSVEMTERHVSEGQTTGARTRMGVGSGTGTGGDDSGSGDGVENGVGNGDGDRDRAGDEDDVMDGHLGGRRSLTDISPIMVHLSGSPFAASSNSMDVSPQIAKANTVNGVMQNRMLVEKGQDGEQGGHPNMAMIRESPSKSPIQVVRTFAESLLSMKGGTLEEYSAFIDDCFVDSARFQLVLTSSLNEGIKVFDASATCLPRFFVALDQALEGHCLRLPFLEQSSPKHSPSSQPCSHDNTEHYRDPIVSSKNVTWELDHPASSTTRRTSLTGTLEASLRTELTSSAGVDQVGSNRVIAHRIKKLELVLDVQGEECVPEITSSNLSLPKGTYGIPNFALRVLEISEKMEKLRSVLGVAATTSFSPREALQSLIQPDGKPVDDNLANHSSNIKRPRSLAEDGDNQSMTFSRRVGEATTSEDPSSQTNGESIHHTTTMG